MLLSRSNDRLLATFNPGDVSNSISYLDFLYERNIFSSDDYLRKLELQSIIGVDGVCDLSLQPWVLPYAFEN